MEVYEADDIAIDSDDDKKIKKAEKRTKEIVDQRAKNKKPRYNNYNVRNASNYDNNFSFRDNSSGYRQFGGNRSASNWNQGSYVPARRNVGRNECYHCGSFRHFINECPERRDRASHVREQKCELAIVGVTTKFIPMNEIYSNMSSDFVPPVYVTSVYEYENSTDNVEISVVGRLKDGLKFMKNIGISPYISDVLEFGYRIPLRLIPESKHLRNNASSRAHPDFVRKSIDKLIFDGAVEECSEPPKIVNPLTVVDRNGKLRLVLDLRYVNEYVVKRKVSFESINLVMNYIKKDGFGVSFDLKSGYHHIQIHPLQHTLLGFAFSDHCGKVHYFKFVVMPFGLNSAGLIFTKVLKEMLKHWRSISIDVFLFLDDGFSIGSDFVTTFNNSCIIKSDLISAGWVPNSIKSSWFPLQRIPWIGAIFDFKLGMIFVSDKKLDQIIDKAKMVLSLTFVAARFLASLVGKIIATMHAIGDIVYIHTRYCQMALAIATCNSWDIIVHVDKNIIDELTFWIDNVYILNGKPFYYNSCANTIVFSDASATGGAAIMSDALSGKEYISHCEWSAQNACKSSTFRELSAVLDALCKFQHLMLNNVLDWYTDAANIVTIVKRGSMNVELHCLALRIFAITSECNIRLRMIWVPRDQVEHADFLSRVIDVDDWQVDPYWFKVISQYFGMPSIDRFADDYNGKLPRFNSRFYSRRAEGIDAFASNWGSDFNYLVPPLFLVPRVVDYLHLCRGYGLLVVPHWRAAFFWPCIVRLLNSKYVKDVLWLGNIFKRGKNKRSLFGSPFWKVASLVLFIDFRSV